MYRMKLRWLCVVYLGLKQWKWDEKYNDLHATSQGRKNKNWDRTKERKGKRERKILKWQKGWDENENLRAREWHYTWQVPEILGDWISKLDGRERANYWN